MATPAWQGDEFPPHAVIYAFKSRLGQRLAQMSRDTTRADLLAEAIRMLHQEFTPAQLAYIIAQPQVDSRLQTWEHEKQAEAAAEKATALAQEQQHKQEPTVVPIRSPKMKPMDNLQVQQFSQEVMAVRHSRAQLEGVILDWHTRGLFLNLVHLPNDERVLLLTDLLNMTPEIKARLDRQGGAYEKLAQAFKNIEFAVRR